MGRKKAIVSACLLGEFVRYDGTTKKDESVVDALKNYEIIPFCPEDPVMGTPRERISVVEADGVKYVLIDSSKIEVTSALTLQVERIIKEHSDASLVVLKAKSPSCGIATTPIFNSEGIEIAKGDGLAAEMFLKHFRGSCFDEKTLFSDGRGFLAHT